MKLNLEEDECLLDRLLKHGVQIAHDCGGVLACAGCRVVVREGRECLEAASEDEFDMLDRAGAVAPGARLACQVKGSAEVVVEIPRQAAPAHTIMQPISLSERAAGYLGRQLLKHPEAVAVRLAVEPAGCSGFRYRVALAADIRDDDAVIERGGARLVVDPHSLLHLQGSTLDVVQEGLARRLRFDNPNVRDSCGCGESFSA